MSQRCQDAEATRPCLTTLSHGPSGASTEHHAWSWPTAGHVHIFDSSIGVLMIQVTRNAKIQLLLEPLLHEQLQHYIYEENSFTRQLTPELQHAFLARFYQIRRPLNVQRDYQGIAIQLWRKK